MSKYTCHRAAGSVSALLGVLALGFTLAYSSDAHAQIKQPGAHPRYSVELEPHLAIQHSHDWHGDDEGFGPGVRVTIPFLDNGPIPKINNNMGIGFGLDWTFYDGCDGRWGDDDCDLNFIWAPVVLQWNFFFTPVISVFGEPGLAIVHASWEYDNRGCDERFADCDESDTDFFEPVFFAGGRFLFSDTVGLVVRLGTPYVSIGATFLL